MLKKCVFFPCVFLCVFVLSTSSTFAQRGRLSLSPTFVESVNVGEQLEFSVNITGGQAVAGYQVALQFDTSALAFASSQNGDYLGAGAFWVPPKVSGNRVELAAASGSERQGLGTLATVRFRVKTVKASRLTLVDGLLSNSGGKTAVPQQLTGAEITTELREVSIPDAVLAGAIRSALGLKAGDPITAGAMQTLTSLEAEWQGIGDLTGLEHATNLQTLRLYYNHISNLTPIEDLTQLRELHLSGNHTRDLTPLENLIQLQTLGLYYNQISDITPLENLIQLQTLGLSGNHISDITPIENLIQLRGLHLGGNKVSDITPLENLTQLQELSLRRNQINDIKPLKTLKRLETLSLYDNQITDVTPIENLIQLRKLSLNDNQINDIKPIENLIQLRELSLNDNNQISDITPLENLTQLQELHLSGNQTRDITSLESLTQLQELHLSGNQISDITPLENLIQLQELHLSGNQINDITSIENLIQLRQLHLSGNQINDITPLENLIQLRQLILYGNQINDITPIENLIQLQALSLADNQISDVTLLVGLVNLQKLFLAGNPSLQDTSPLADLYDQLTDKDFEITEPRLPADVNNDGTVNISDLVLVVRNFGKTVLTPPEADINGDGIVNIADLVLVAGAFGTGGGAPILHASILDLFTTTEVKTWLSQAQHLDTTDPVSEKGIRFLAQLLAILTPKDTVLLPNYPNPFNPETWIPYQLATATDVQITIYDVTGKVVRRLDVGHQPAGYYTDRSRAAYWDGKNALGESMASGVYFYTITTENFSGTKKMLIRK